MRLCFMTFNIQHGVVYLKQKAKELQNDPSPEEIDLELMASVIREQNADIVGLNEVRGRGVSPDYTAQAEQLAALLGYHCYFARAISFGDGNPYGNAILSRFPLQSVETVPIPDPEVKDEDAYYETRCVLRARFQEAGGFTVIISHFGLAVAEQKNAVQTIAALLNEEKSPVVVMGDFNLEPQSPVLAPLFARLTDTASAFLKPLKSWPSDEPEQKIDYILVKGAQVLKADIPAITASDHRPHIAWLEF